MDAPVTSIESAEASLRGRVLLDRYQLGKRLGRGELGDVYEADDLLRRSISDEAAVAVKVFRPSLVSACGGVGTMAPMLATACRLSHPNVINAFDFYKDGGTLFLAMERLSGGTLAEQLATLRGGPPLSVTNADAALREVVGALVYIHSTTKRPLLRLNPQRLWLAGENRQLCVADLCLGSLVDPHVLRQSAMMSGMSAYLAPELVTGSDAWDPDCRADQYSLGALAMAVFTGSPRGSLEGLHRALERDRTGAAIWIDLLPRLLGEKPEDRFNDLEGVRELLLSAPTARRGRRGRLRALVEGNSASAVKGKAKGLRASWMRRPMVLAATGVLGLGLAIATWAIGPDLLFRNQWQSIATGEIDGARRQLHQLDALRMDLQAKGLNREPFHAVVRRLAVATPDYAIVDSLQMAGAELKVGDNESAQVLLSSANASLGERMDQIGNAMAAIDGCDRLLELREMAASLDSLDERFSPVGDAAVDMIDTRWLDAADAFQRGHFNEAAVQSAEAAEKAEVALGAAIRDRHAESIEARDAWRDALSGLGNFPEIDPIGEPGKRIVLGEAALASGDRIEAARSFIAARDRYRAWADELMGTRMGGDQAETSGSPGEESAKPAADQVGFTNSIGMKFLPVGDLMASIWETRLIDFLAFTYATGVDAGYQWRDFAVTGAAWRGGDDPDPPDLARMWGDLSVTPIQGPCHPVTMVCVADAQRFCEWLTQRERQAGLIRGDQAYRLPSDLEWSRLAGVEDDPSKTPNERSFDHPTHYPWGDEPVRWSESGNYATWPSREMRSVWVEEQDPWMHTAPVGSFAPNASGLYDIGGNVWERTSETLHGRRFNGEDVVRGGGWKSLDIDTFRTACRDTSRMINQEVGFRVVLAPDDALDKRGERGDEIEGATEPAIDQTDGD